MTVVAGGTAEDYARVFAESAASKHTAASRVRDLIGSPSAKSPGWIEWCAAQNVDPLKTASADDVRTWLSELETAGDGESTRNRRVSSVGSWYQWLKLGLVVHSNPVEFVGVRPRAAKYLYPVPQTSLPSVGQAIDLQRAADADGAHSAAAISILLTTGIRASELAAVKIGDIDQQSRVIRVLGKGDKQRLVYLPAETWRRVQTILTARTDDPDEYLMVAPDGGRVDRGLVTRLLARVSRRAGVADLGLRPHGLRHGFVTDLLTMIE